MTPKASRNMTPDTEASVISDDPMEFAALAAVLAGLKVTLVVATHFRRDAGNVVSPAGQNAANEFVTALR
jgi:hypothetical protein